MNKRMKKKLHEVLNDLASEQINELHKNRFKFKKNQQEIYQERFKQFWPIIYIRKRFYEAPIKSYLKQAAYLQRLPEKCLEEFPWKVVEMQVHKKRFLLDISDAIKCAYNKEFRCPKYLRETLRKKCNFKWNSVGHEPVKVKLSCNPLYLRNSRRQKFKFTNIPLLSPDLWDSKIHRVQKILDCTGFEQCIMDLSCIYQEIQPIPAINGTFEDPYSAVQAEMKILGMKGVNFIVLSRSYFSSKQLAKKLAFEMNSIFLDPMEIMEHHYHTNEAGFYVPSKLKDKFQEYYMKKLVEHKTRLTKELKILMNLMRSSKSLELLKSEECALSEEQHFIQNNEEENILEDFKPCGSSFYDLGFHQKFFVPLLLKEDFSIRDDLIDVSGETLSEGDSVSLDLNKRNVSKSASGRSRTVSVEESGTDENINKVENDSLIIHQRKSSLSLENSPILQYIFGKTLSVFDLEETLRYLKEKSFYTKSSFVRALRKLAVAILNMNIQLPESMWPKLISKKVESTACYARGYVFLGSPINFSDSKYNIKYWKTVFQAKNPPDVVVYGECPEEEFEVLLEELRLNPFLHSESYCSDFLLHIRQCSDLYKYHNSSELSAIVAQFFNVHKSKDIPIYEALVIEYHAMLQRERTLGLLTNHQNLTKRKWQPFLPENEEIHESGSEENDTAYHASCRFKGCFLPLEAYVRLPKHFTQHVSEINNYFNFEAIFLNIFTRNYSATCVLRTDIRTPVNYQLSIIKRWFDYSGLYAKPRAKSGDIGKVSILCELISRSKDKDRLALEFMTELSSRMKNPTGPIKGLTEEEEASSVEERFQTHNYEGKAEEKLEVLEEESVHFNPSSVSGTSSEYGIVARYPLGDEFYFLKDEWEDNLSVAADEYELSSRDDPAFFRTHQCYLSSWNDRCPVAHYYYKCRRGSFDYSVRLHDKVYFMSSNLAMKAFIKNPTKYLVPMLPEAHCQVMILGEKMSGKTYIAEALARFFDAYVINFKELVEFAVQELKRKYIRSMNKKMTALITLVFLEDFSVEYTDKIMECVQWLEKAYQLVLFRTNVFKPKQWDLYETVNGEDPEDRLFSIPELFPYYVDESYIKELLKDCKLTPEIIDMILTAGRRLSNTAFQPYFLEDSQKLVTYLDTHLDLLLRNNFRIMGLDDVYGNYDLCETYSSDPCRLLERLPIIYLPNETSAEPNISLKSTLEFIDNFFTKGLALSAKEKIDALGSFIISIEDQKRKEEVMRYGGWIIDDMPNDEKLLKALDNAGLFPRNVIFLDNFENTPSIPQHATRETRIADLEKNLACYVIPNLRNEMLPLTEHYTNSRHFGEFIFKEENTECYTNFIIYSGNKLARLQSLYTLLREIGPSYKYQNEDDIVDSWPGEKGTKNQVLYTFLYDSLSSENRFNKLEESSLESLKSFDIMDTVLQILERKHVKPLESLGLLHSFIVKAFQPFIYFSLKYANISKVQLRIFKLLDCLYSLLREDTYAHAILEFMPFNFIEKKTINDSPQSMPSVGFSYLYHLAYALENIMSVKDSVREPLFDNIYSTMVRMGYSTCVHGLNSEVSTNRRNEKAICEESYEISDLEKTDILKCTDYNFLELNLLSPYFLNKMFSTKSHISTAPYQKKDECVEPQHDSGFVPNISKCVQKSETVIQLIQKIHILALQKQGRSSKKLKKLQELLISALKVILELNVSCFIHSNIENCRDILYFPRGAMFLQEEEKMYDLGLITNKLFCEEQKICDDIGNFNYLIMLLYEDYWKDWYFDQSEDYNCNFQYTFWKSEYDSMDANELLGIEEYISKEKTIQTKTLCLIKNIYYIQSMINSLKNMNKLFLSYDEEAILNYFIWLRNRLIKKHQAFFGIMGVPGYGQLEARTSPFFPSGIPSFSEVYFKLNKGKTVAINSDGKFTKENLSKSKWNPPPIQNNEETDGQNNDNLKYNFSANKINESKNQNFVTRNIDKKGNSAFETRCDIELTYFNEPWPFRSNWRNLPKFMGLYDSRLFYELSKTSARTYEYNLETPDQTEKSVMMPIEKKVIVDEVKKKNKFDDYETFKWTLVFDIPLILNEDNTVLKFKNSEAAESTNQFKDENENVLIEEYIESNSRNDKFIGERLSFQKGFKKVIYNTTPQKYGLLSAKEKTKTSFNTNLQSSPYETRNQLLNRRNLQLERESTFFMSVIRFKTLVNNTFNATKLTWMSLDEYGPFKVLYFILNVIRGAKNIPVIKRYILRDDLSDIEAFGEEQTIYGEENLMKIEKVDKEELCIVSLVDGFIRQGSRDVAASLRGQEYYFCSHECMMRFLWCPEMFVNITKPFEHLYPFNIFYSELPGGVGKFLSSLLSYYFGSQLFNMDDYLVRRFAPIKNAVEDLKSLVVMSDLRIDKRLNWDSIATMRHDVLKGYLLLNKFVPQMKYIIDHIWKKDNFCIYNFPYNPENFVETIKEAVIPEVILRSNIECLKLFTEFQSYDIIDNYVGQIVADKLNSTEKHKLFMFWARVWKSRFKKILTFLRQEDIDGSISRLQFNLLQLNRRYKSGSKQLDFINIKKNQSIWSENSIPLNIPKALENRQCSSAENSFLDNDSRNNCIRNLLEPMPASHNYSICPTMPDELVEKKHKLPSDMNSNPKGVKLFKYLNEKNLSFDSYENILKECFEGDTTNSTIHLLDAFKMLRLFLDFQLSEYKQLMNEKEDIIISSNIENNEEDLKQEILSVDSVAFEDYDNQPTLNEISGENSLRLLAMSLKHTNDLNPIPNIYSDKKYFETDAESLCNLLKVFIQNFQKYSNECMERIKGVKTDEVDCINDEMKDIIENIRLTRKLPRNAECVKDIERADVEKLLESGFYFLSSFGRQCPVQLQKKCIYPQKKILYDSSNVYPVVHRRFIYFLESQKALDAFKTHPLDYTNAAEHNPIIPIKIVLFGPNTQRTMKFVKALVKEYSLNHISVSKAIEYYIKMSSFTRTGQKLKWLTSYVIGLSYPNALPLSLVWQAVQLMITTPKSVTHGYIITGFKPEVDLFRQWEQTKFRPHLILYITVVDPPLFCCHQIQKVKSLLKKISSKQAKAEIMLKYYLEASPSFMKNEYSAWRKSSHQAYIKFLDTYYYNVHIFQYENSSFATYYKMSMCILDVFRTLKLMYNNMYKEMDLFIPIGKLISKNEHYEAASQAWNDNCPVCICSELRVSTRSKSEINDVYLFQGKTAWMCKQHKLSSLVWSSPNISSLNLDVYFRVSAETFIPKKIKNFQFEGLCPVCYWQYKPNEELRYRYGSMKHFCSYASKYFKLCSNNCLNEFKYTPLIYGCTEKFLDVRTKYSISPLKNYPFDTSFWDPVAMKDQISISILGKCTKCLLYHHLMRLAVLFGLQFPGWTKNEARIFFIYVMTQCYLSTDKRAERWRIVLLDFLRLSGTSKRILSQFCATRGKELPQLIEYLIGRI